MLVVRVVVVLVAIALGVCVLLWLLTRERKWLRYAGRLFTVAVSAVVILLLLLVGERLIAL